MSRYIPQRMLRKEHQSGDHDNHCKSRDSNPLAVHNNQEDTCKSVMLEDFVSLKIPKSFSHFQHFASSLLQRDKEGI